MSALTVDVPREWLLNANDRRHWREKAKRTACLRAAGYLHGRDMPHFTEKVRCEVLISWPDRRRRDAHNLAVLKPLIDGFVDAQVIADDSDRHLVGPDLRVSDQLCDKRYACTLTFTFTPVEVAG